MTASRREALVAPADLTRFLLAFGLVPLLFARIDVALVDPPWSFALTPGWSTGQLVVIVGAGALLGVTSGRPAQGLAAVTFGVLAGLALDLWLFAGDVAPGFQTFVTLLPADEWRSRVTVAALVLALAIAAGFVAGVLVRRFVSERPPRPFGRPMGSETAAIGLAVVGGPILAVVIGIGFSSSALVVPDGSQTQAVTVSNAAIAVEPTTLRPGPTRFRCQVTADAISEWTRLVVVPETADIDSILPSIEDVSTCGYYTGIDTWGPIADLRPGRYVWIQIDQSGPRVLAMSPEITVAP